jgi:protein-S-isoprenylcysteine O-methyltransferase Ste14
MSMLEIEQALPPETPEAEQASPVVPGPPASRRNSGKLDLLEWLLVLGGYAFFFWNFLPHFCKEPDWPTGLVIASESMTVLVLLIRRPAQSFSTSLSAWLVALGTTVMPFLLLRDRSFAPIWVGMTLVAMGLCCRIICTLFLGRSFGLVAANRGVTRTGPYRLVRHPMYASYLIVHLGFVWLNPAYWNIFVLLVCWCLMRGRILMEESHLSQDPAYVEYQKVVRFRLIPGLF